MRGVHSRRRLCRARSSALRAMTHAEEEARSDPGGLACENMRVNSSVGNFSSKRHSSLAQVVIIVGSPLSLYRARAHLALSPAARRLTKTLSISPCRLTTSLRGYPSRRNPRSRTRYCDTALLRHAADDPAVDRALYICGIPNAKKVHTNRCTTRPARGPRLQRGPPRGALHPRTRSRCVGHGCESDRAAALGSIGENGRGMGARVEERNALLTSPPAPSTVGRRVDGPEIASRRTMSPLAVPHAEGTHEKE
ncbi:hypothetical protein C8Q70DRAFT_350097 [Cubamyces menziesii]|nr:hypothetical protein C8Q70DRAFT_350097 [Cubamyces menziesii]